jgi:hypothetical protein
MEKALPYDRKITQFILAEKPDLVLLTPLVNIASDQTDYLKSARFLGINCGLCVASWDNLTNKGLIQLEPDAVIVWNEIQKSEAIELHGIPPSKVVVTGAQCYDKWFTQKPSSSREEFCRRVGLSSEKSFILYLCSSPFIAPQEVKFVETWIREIRNCKDPNLNNVGVLVRPHPQNAEQWENVDFSHLENVTIYPRLGANPVDETGKSDFYDSMYYSAAVVGINTSSMIESGILGRPVFTIITDDFRATQEGTLHFHYLAEGGLLNISRSFDEHIGQLSKGLNGDKSHVERIRTFIQEFVRPQGLDTACTPIVVKAIEDLGNAARTPPERTPIWCYPVRVLLSPLAFLLMLIKERWSSAVRKDKTALKNVPGKKTARKKLPRVMRVMRPVLLPAARYVSRMSVMQDHVTPWLMKEQAGTSNHVEASAQLKKDVEKMLADGKPIIVGPWLSEVGFEILYWIPFLNWVMTEYKVDRERITVISRGGAEKWYNTISSNYVDIFDHFTEDEFRVKNQDRILATGGQKHINISRFDEEIIQVVRETSGNMSEFGWLHPSLMYGLFRYYWGNRSPVSLVERHSEYRRFRPISGEEVSRHLPDRYVAAKFYFSNCFPDTETNRQFIAELLRTLAKETHVVVLSTGLNLDDHKDLDVTPSSRIHVINDLITPRNNLDIQTQVTGRATAFVGTYGGFSYLAPHYGVPSVAFFSREDKFLQVHLDVANRACRFLKFGKSGVRAGKAKTGLSLSNESGDKHELIAMNVSNMKLMEILTGAVKSRMAECAHDRAI